MQRGEKQREIFAIAAFLLLLSSLQPSQGFIQTGAAFSRTFFYRTPSTKTDVAALNLTPIARFRNQLNFFDQPKDHRCCFDRDGRFIEGNKDDNENENPFQLCIVEEDDLPEVTLFIIKAFGADAINLSSNEFSEFEKTLLKPALGFFNGYAAVSAFAEVLWGLRLRLKGRVLSTEDDETNPINDISPPHFAGLSNQEKNLAASQKSLVLVLARQNTEKGTNSSKWTSIDSDIDVIASVELQLQVCLFCCFVGNSTLSFFYFKRVTHHSHSLHLFWTSHRTARFHSAFHGGIELNARLLAFLDIPRTQALGFSSLT
jgi:hypothetical protein